MNRLSHIERDLELIKAKRKEQAQSFDPSSFRTEDKITRMAMVEVNDFEFAREYFPEESSIEYGDIHREWDVIFNRGDREIHLIAGPNRFGKSQLLRIVRIKKMLFKKFKHGKRVGENLEDAENEIELTKLELTNNPRILFDFGETVDPKYRSQGEIVMKNGVTFMPLSPRVKARGFTHSPDYVEIDDFEDIESAINPDRGKKKLAWLVSELYMGTSKDAIIIWLANNLDIDSACNQFIEKQKTDPNDKFFTHIYPALVDGKSTWEQGWTKEELLALKKVVGTVYFEANMQQNPMRPGETFKPDWIRYVELSEVKKTKGTRRVGLMLDPSYGESDTACYKAYVVASTDGKNFDVMDVWLRQSSVRAMFNAMIDITKKWSGWNIVFNRWETTMSNKLLRKDLVDVLFERGETITFGGYEDQTPKAIRIESLSMPIETGVIRFCTEGGRPSEDMKRLIEQLMLYPKKPDDGPDALAMCYGQLMKMYWGEGQSVYKSLAKRVHQWRSKDK